MYTMAPSLSEGKNKKFTVDSTWEEINSESAKLLDHPVFLEMLIRTLPASSLRTYANDQVQVSNDAFSVKGKENYPVRASNYGHTIRAASTHLQVGSRRPLEGISGSGKTSPKVSCAALSMTQLIQSNAESENTSDEFLTGTAILRLRHFLEKAFSDRLSVSAPRNQFCGVWLSTVASSQFQATLALVQEELRRVLSLKMTATEMQRVHAIFNAVVKLELSLFDSANSRSQEKIAQPQLSTYPWDFSNILFTTDFDVTCTVVDSCEVLVEAAEAAAMKSSSDLERGKLHRDYEAALVRHSNRIQETLRNLENKELGNKAVTPRLSGRDENSSDLVPGMDPSLKPFFDRTIRNISLPSDENSQGVPFDEAGLRSALTKLSDLEVLCNQDVMSAGVLRGSSKEDIKEESKQVVLRENCSQVLRHLVDIGTNIHVVSANWSRDLIIGGLPELPKEKVFLHCNDLLFDDSGVSTGAFDMTVVDAFDKEHMLRALRKMCNFEQTELASSEAGIPSRQDKKVEKMVVYMGDSYTDILGLLEADLGIVIGKSRDMRRVISFYGIQLLPLSSAATDISVARLNKSERSWRRSGILFEAQGWDDVGACLFGFKSSSIPSSVSSAEISKWNDKRPNDQSVQQQKLYLNTNNGVSQDNLPPAKLKFVQVAC